MDYTQLAITILRLIAFFLSVLGYVLFAHIELRARFRYSFIFVLSSISCVIYFSGLVGLLEPATWVVFAGGIILLLVYVIKKQLSTMFNWKAVNVLNIVFGLALVILVVSLLNARFIHYDNYSHWGVVVKYMLLNDSFPDASSAIIDFKTYPLGSSSYLYYFCKIVGGSQGLMLVGQAILILACFFAMFSVVWDRRRLMLPALLGLFLSLMSIFNISIRINTLLVDFLLPSLALAAIGIMVMHRYHFKRMCIFITPILALLSVTKNSGLFFSAICFGYLIYIALRSKKYRAPTKRWARVLAALLVISLTLSTFLAWQVHSGKTFEGENSKHTMSMDNFEEVYTDKTPEIISEITDKYVSEVFSLQSQATMAILLFNVAAVAAYLIARLGFKKRWKLLNWLIALDIAVVVYYVGIYAMFILTMPVDEALILAGFERYASSMVIFFIGALAMCACVDVEKSMFKPLGAQRDYRAFKTRTSKSMYQNASMLFLCLMAVTLLSEINGMNSMKNDYPTSLPVVVEEITGDNWLQVDESRYLFYASDTDRQISDYFLQYIGRYYLFAPEVDAVSSIDADSFEAKLNEYDYFVIIETDAAVNKQFRRRFGRNAEPGIYPVDLFISSIEV